MKPKSPKTVLQNGLFRSELSKIINMQHELVKLSQAIDWAHLETKVSAFYAEIGRPARM